MQHVQGLLQMEKIVHRCFAKGTNMALLHSLDAAGFTLVDIDCIHIIDSELFTPS